MSGDSAGGPPVPSGRRRRGRVMTERRGLLRLGLFVLILAAGALTAVLLLRPASPAPPSANGPPAPSSLAPPGKTAVYAFTAGSSNITNPTRVTAELEAASFRPDGIDWVLPWSMVEPRAGVYDWTVVDGDLAAATAAGFRSFIEIIPGISDPQWALTECPTVQVSFAGGARSGTMCVPTSPAFLQLWTTFIAAFGQRYDGRAGLTMVQASGCGALGEMELPNHDPAFWARLGVTSDSLLMAWEQVIGAWRSALPHTPSSLAIDEPLGIGNSSVLDPLLAYARQHYGPMLWVQQNGLRPGWLSKPISYRQELAAASTWTTVGWQLAGTSSKYGSLTTSLSEGLTVRPRFYEVYLADLLDGGNRQALSAVANGSAS